MVEIDPRVSVGRHTYGQNARTFRLWGETERIGVGAFCSIAADVRIFGGGEHHAHGVTTFPLAAKLPRFPSSGDEARSKGPTRIGNDVWIGHGAYVLSGVSVGDGAIIGAGAVVTRDVPPYGVAAGNPARVLRMRFDRPIIERLLGIAWWHWSDERIRDFAPAFAAGVEAFLAAAEATPIGEAPRVSEPAVRAGADYLGLLKRALTGEVHQETFAVIPEPSSVISAAAAAELERAGIVAARPTRGVQRRKQTDDGRTWPLIGETMVGRKRLENVQQCVESVLADGVPGDLIEAGTWRGGAAIFMRALLVVHGVHERRVVVADSFEGLPPPSPDRYPADAGDAHHLEPVLAVPLEVVRENFRRYDMLDDRVEFVSGWFRDTLPGLRDRTWAVIRLDGDMYESTIDGLRCLYDGLSAGGYVIVDDYGAVPGARAAVEDFRAQRRIAAPLVEIDWTGVYWRKPEAGPSDA